MLNTPAPDLLPPDGLTLDQAAALELEPAAPPALASAVAAILTRLAKADLWPALDARDTLSKDQIVFAFPPLTTRPQ
jgi:hypothetical protein